MATTKQATREKREQRVDNERESLERKGDRVDIASDDSFPASDPPSHTPVKGEKEDVRPLNKQKTS